MAKLRITQRRSLNGVRPSQRATLRSLGLRRIGHQVEHDDTPQLRGMVHRVRHMVEVEEQKPGEAGRSRAAGGRTTASEARAGGPQGQS
jgi:large subunit ribosomal protein L30